MHFEDIICGFWHLLLLKSSEELIVIPLYAFHPSLSAVVQDVLPVLDVQQLR